jgi:hypothetical protein
MTYTINNSYVLFWEMCAAALMAAQIVLYLVLLKKLITKTAAWNEAKQQGELIRQQIAMEMERLRQHKNFVEDGPEQLDQYKKAGMGAIISGMSLASQVPTVLGEEHIRKKLFAKYDPKMMRASFLSLTAEVPEESRLKNVLMTVIYGVNPEHRNEKDRYFVAIYDMQNTLQMVRMYPDFPGETWNELMFAFSKITCDSSSMLEQTFS